jgi:general secretion pathway protein F
MTAFVYKALDERGQFVTGELQAASTSAAVEQLIDLGYVPLETSPGDTARRSFWTSLLPRPTVSQRDVTVLLQDLALLLRSGLPLDEGLHLLVENAGGATVRLIAQLRAAIGSGANFAEALQSHPATARPELIAVARSGEATGRLDSALETIAGERLRQERINAQIRTALRYPAFLLVVAGGVLLFFLTFVVPQFADVVRDFGTQKGWLIGMIIAASAALRQHGDLIAAAALVLVLVGVLAWRIRRLRHRLVAPLLHLPVLSGIIVLRRTAQFCRTLGILLSSGVNLADALRLMNESAIGGEQLAAVSDRVRRGERLVDALMEAKLVPPLAARMLRVGEESGALATVALRCAGYYEAKLTEQVDRLTGIVGPAAIVFISIVIGTLVVSVMETLLSVNQMVA